jgi:sugar phosphate permease
MFLGWSCYNLIRYNFICTITSLIEHRGFSQSDVGMISSCFSMAYGVSKFLSSVISDHASSHQVFSGGLILAGVCSFFFPLARTVALACVVWFVEGITQGCGWPPCVILLKAWYPPSQIGKLWSILGSVGSIVSAVLPFVVIFITSTFHWSTSYYVFGVCALAMGVLANFSIKDTPGDLVKKNGPAAEDQEKKKEDGKNKVSKWYSVFFIPDLLMISAVYAILYFVLGSCIYWSQLFFVQEAEMTETRAATFFGVYQVGAVIGNIFAGPVSDIFITPVSYPSITNLGRRLKIR